MVIRLFEDHGLVAVVKATSRLAIFLQTELGASYLRRGAAEPSLKKLLPAKTFLVMVPTNSTALSVAKELAGRTNSEQAVVKVGLETNITRRHCIFSNLLYFTTMIMTLL